jgi:DNA-binding MarR family transcriptional regulator
MDRVYYKDMNDQLTTPADGSPAAWDVAQMLVRFVKAMHEIERCNPKQESGLSVQQLRGLLHLARSDGSTIKQLAEALSVSEARASRLAEELTLIGKIESRRDSTDRRHVRLYATASGAEKARRILGQRLEALDTALSGVPVGEIDAFMDVLGRIVDQMECLAERSIRGDGETVA